MLSLRNVTRAFSAAPSKENRGLTLGSVPSISNREVLHDVSLEVGTGEYIAIVGESGVGKSTLLNLIAGLDQPDAGQVLIDGDDLRMMSDDALTELRRDKIGFVFQAFHVLPYLTVARNVVLPLQLQNVNADEASVRVSKMLASVGLQQRADSLPRELSGGELQRIAIARALIHRPKLVLADEPTGNLDRDNAELVLALLRDCVKESGSAAILVTHSDRAAKSTDRVYQLTPEGLRAQSAT